MELVELVPPVPNQVISIMKKVRRLGRKVLLVDS
jgi:hypothetical protein